MLKLFPLMQDQINFGLEYPDNIKDLKIYFQKFYDQIIAIDRIQLNIK